MQYSKARCCCQIQDCKPDQVRISVLSSHVITEYPYGRAHSTSGATFLYVGTQNNEWGGIVS
jgi:hypothetical protein